MKTKRNGFVTIFYLIFYGMIRIVLESFRQPQYVLKMFGLPVSQIVSGLMIAFGVILLVLIVVKKENQNSKIKGVKK